LTKARAVPSVRPLRSQALDASQYSSNDKGLRLMMSVKPISPFPNLPIEPSYHRCCDLDHYRANIALACMKVPLDKAGLLRSLIAFLPAPFAENDRLLQMEEPNTTQPPV
jgi:hypothetical protein